MPNINFVTNIIHWLKQYCSTTIRLNQEIFLIWWGINYHAALFLIYHALLKNLDVSFQNTLSRIRSFPISSRFPTYYVIELSYVLTLTLLHHKVDKPTKTVGLFLLKFYNGEKLFHQHEHFYIYTSFYF